MHPPDFWMQPPGLLAIALAPLGALYDLAGRLRRAAVRPARAPVPVVCVGNLTLGGAGKTPVAIALVERLKALSASPVALSRGYGGALAGPLTVEPDHTAAEVGDEPLLLSRHAPAVIARDRRAGAAEAVRAGAGVIVMDDGFQNPFLAKDLSIAVVDSETGFGNGFVFPAGPLRENAARGLARADAVVLMGDGPFRPEHPRVLRARLQPLAGRIPSGRRVIAFAGIARPEKFVATMKAEGAVVEAAYGFPDHHRFTREDLDLLHQAAKERHGALWTTEKDFVRLPPAWREGIAALPVRAVFEDSTALDDLLQRALSRPAQVS